jgi:DNA-binding ferritin-like protein
MTTSPGDEIASQLVQRFDALAERMSQLEQRVSSKF